MPRWLRSYWLMLKWQALSLKPVLSIAIAIEIVIPLAVVIGMSFLFPEIDPDTARFLTTGGATISLITIGMVMLPQMVAMARTQGVSDYVRVLPVPRMVFLAVDATLWLAMGLPGVVLSLVMGSAYYHFGLHVVPLVVPAVLMVALCGIFVGNAFSLAVPKPEMAHLISQVNIFFTMLFSPINYPVERLPDWFGTLHRGLPMMYMADLVRGTMTDMDVNLGLAFGVVGAWLAVGFVVTYVLTRRRR